MTSTTTTQAAPENTSTQDGPTAAAAPRRIPLGTRLALFVALSVATVVIVLTIAGTRLAARQLENDLRETARVTAIALADDIELRPEPWAADALMPALRDFLNAAADLRSITVFRAAPGSADLVVGTSIVDTAPPGAVREAIATDEPVWNDGTPHTAIIVVPIHREDAVTGAVAVAVSLAAVAQLQRTTGLVAAAGAAFAIGAITLLIHLLARRLILDPLSEIERVTALARTGDLSARAHVSQPGELRDVADGLNAMLADLEQLHHSLRDLVGAATAELQLRNEQLVRSYESVSQLRETAAGAQQLAAVGQTLANVAHQIGTPLNLISAHVQLLRQEIVDPSLQRRLRIVEDQAERMASAVRDLLERARPDGERRPVRIGAVLTTIGNAIRVKLAASQVALDLRIADPLPDIAANEAQIELALLNLVTNALDAMPDGGTLTLAAEPAPGGVCLKVADTGSGISAEVLPRIFEPWVTTKAAGHGTGLGLSIAHDVISGIGGTIAVTTGTARGTTFTIMLPAMAALQQAS